MENYKTPEQFFKELRLKINGRIYDTETAKCVVTKKDYWHPDTFTKLYQKKNGEYFGYFSNVAAPETEKMHYNGLTNQVKWRKYGGIAPLTDDEAADIINEWGA